eukprot:TRINITY_DN55107_c0_g1_i1.p1 TRINITY_DN55107_c0_g1~~TRINITY_DN55107_c0_g1_i1.p1  ORF type:complete len:561 (-),score=145.78 TRINITY_DN55107_c0_g1_i1:105-1787(-)
MTTVAEPPDYYAVLGLPTTADGAAVRLAYRQQALRVHPDKGGTDAEFKAVAEAFEILSSAVRRAAYDAERTTIVSPVPAAAAASTPASRKERALVRLKAAVDALARGERWAALNALPPAVATALLDYMTKGNAEAVPSLVKQRGGDRGAKKRLRPQSQLLVRPPVPPQVASASTPSASSSAAPPPATPSLGPSDAVAPAAATTDVTSALVPLREPEAGRQRRTGGYRGIHKIGSKSNLYQASINCLNLEIRTKGVAELEDALKHHSVLVLVRNDVTDREPAPERLWEAFEKAITKACDDVCIRRSELGLSFRPGVSAIAEVGRQIHGQSTSDLWTALEKRRELVAAKAAGWSQLREVWIRLLVESRSQAQAEVFVDTAFRAHESQRQRAKREPVAARPSATTTSELQLAAKAVQQALDAESRQSSPRLSAAASPRVSPRAATSPRVTAGGASAAAKAKEKAAKAKEKAAKAKEQAISRLDARVNASAEAAASRHWGGRDTFAELSEELQRGVRRRCASPSSAAKASVSPAAAAAATAASAARGRLATAERPMSAAQPATA